MIIINVFLEYYIFILKSGIIKINNKIIFNNTIK